jgi:hypothetical protein
MRILNDQKPLAVACYHFSIPKNQTLPEAVAGDSAFAPFGHTMVHVDLLFANSLDYLLYPPHLVDEGLHNKATPHDYRDLGKPGYRYTLSINTLAADVAAGLASEERRVNEFVGRLIFTTRSISRERLNTAIDSLEREIRLPTGTLDILQMEGHADNISHVEIDPKGNLTLPRRKEILQGILSGVMKLPLKNAFGSSEGYIPIRDMCLFAPLLPRSVVDQARSEQEATRRQADFHRVRSTMLLDQTRYMTANNRIAKHAEQTAAISEAAYVERSAGEARAAAYAKLQAQIQEKERIAAEHLKASADKAGKKAVEKVKANAKHN